MAKETISDAEQAEEQLYAAVDMGDDASGDEIYIAVDRSEAELVNAAVGGGVAPKQAVTPTDKHVESTAGEGPDLSRSDTSGPQLSAEQTDVGVSSEPAGVAAAGDTTAAATANPVNLRLPDTISTPQVPLRDATEELNAERLPEVDARIALIPASSTESTMTTARGSTSSPPEAVAALPQSIAAPPGTLSSEGENFASAVSRNSARSKEKKEPALLGEFVSLDDMEGRQHLRFASKSPEPTPQACAHGDFDATSSAPPSNNPKPGKPAFTPFLSVITGGVSVPPSPAASASGSRKQAKRKSLPQSPDTDGTTDAAAVSEEKKKKRARDAVSPSSSAASFQTASSRIDEAMAKNKKPRKLADRLHDRPQTSSINSPHDSAVSQRSNTDPAQVTRQDRVRATSGSVDMDIDGETTTPTKGLSVPADDHPPTHTDLNGSPAFNADQVDFMALDVEDEEEDPAQAYHFQRREGQRDALPSQHTEPRAFPDRGPSGKGKGRATDGAMCAECGGISAHGESCSRSLVCTSCNETGHTSQYCSASWRGYVYHTPQEREAAIERKATIAAEGGWKYEAVGVLVLDGSVGQCYNCGLTGHRGDDCPEPHWHETYPHPLTAFSWDNAQLGPFAKKSVSESDPVFVQSQRLLHESGANRGANLRPGSMGREKQKQIMRRQGGNAGEDIADEDEDDWFDKANRGNQGRFPGRGNRLGQSPPSNPRGNSHPNNRAAGNSSRFSIQIRGMAGNTAQGNSSMRGGGNSGTRFHQSNQREQNRNGNSGYDRARERGGRDYPSNDRDSAAHNFYSSGQGGGAVSEWETDYRRSDQHFKPQPNAGYSGSNDGYARDRNASNGRTGDGRGNGQNRGGGQNGNEGQQGRGYGGHRQNYYGGY